MILVFGGTTEGRKAVEVLEESGKAYYYSTKTGEQELALHHGHRIDGALGSEAMLAFCKEHDIRLIVNAAHPFAKMLHETIVNVAAEAAIPVIRYERIYPPRDADITWIDNYDDIPHDIHSLLATTGVQSIAKLKPLEQQGVKIYYRILPRESSVSLAKAQGVSDHQLCYYENGHTIDVDSEAILLKESGLSGGFCEKVEAARKKGMRIVALKRPELHFKHTVNGPYGLRRAVERLLPEFFPLHSGLTTGTCATAAAVAETIRMTSGETPLEVPVMLPNGETLYVAVGYGNGYAYCRKEAGDDPDITNGVEIRAILSPSQRGEGERRGERIEERGERIDLLSRGEGERRGERREERGERADLLSRGEGREERGERADLLSRTSRGESILSPLSSLLSPLSSLHSPLITIEGGEGVGTITLPGFDYPPGSPAINKVPREMIEQNVKSILAHSHPLDLKITISVPNGAEIARKTFNPRLGIEGGISIIGVSGIVKPFSEEAFIDSIRKCMTIAKASGSERVVINSGGKSERFVKNRYPELPSQAFVEYGNYIGETLKIAHELAFPYVTIGVMLGKAVKLAAGHLDTHSRKTTMDLGFIEQMLHEAGVGIDISDITLARELWDRIPEEKISAFSDVVITHCLSHCRQLLPNGRLTILLIADDGTIHSLSQVPPQGQSQN